MNLFRIPGLLLLMVAGRSASAAEQTYTNPVLPGFHPDPSIVRVGEDFYLVNSTFQYFPAILISHSKDLVHWQPIGHVFTKSEDLDLRPFFDGMGVWAPDISYHDGEFYIFYCLVQLSKDRSVNVRGNYMVKSKSILGPWSTPVQLTTEGNDPSHFVDDDGTHYMCYAAGIPKGSATKIVKLSPDCTKVVEGPFWIDYGGEKRAPEGPHLFKRNGMYYHTMAASGGIYNGHHQLIARSANILGPYEFGPQNPFIAQADKTSIAQHQGHAKLVETQNGEWWAVYLMQRRLNGFSPLGRETGLDRVHWTDDGWPVLNEGRGPSVSSPAPNLPVTVYDNPLGDEFDAPSPGIQWQFVRNPEPSLFSLTERNGWLRLRCGPAGLDSTQARNVMVQREVSLKYTASTKIDFQPVPGAEAGLVCYYDTKTYLKCALTGTAGSNRRLVVEECRKGKRSVLAEVPEIPRGPIYLRVRVDGLKRTFDYSTDNRNWVPVADVPDCSFLSDQGTPNWGFMGTMVGIYAAGGDPSSAADFDWFHHEVGK